MNKPEDESTMIQQWNSTRHNHTNDFSIMGSQYNQWINKAKYTATCKLQQMTKYALSQLPISREIRNTTQFHIGTLNIFDRQVPPIEESKIESTLHTYPFLQPFATQQWKTLRRPKNHASPTKETGRFIPGILPHGPFVTLSHPLPTPQPGIESKNPSFVPERINEAPIATRSKTAPA